MNPPYGRKIGNWVKKARDAARQGKARKGNSRLFAAGANRYRLVARLRHEG